MGGLAYYVSRPESIGEMLLDPFRAIFYITFVLGSCALISKTWIDVSGTSPRDVARQLRDQRLFVKGHRPEKLEKELNRYVCSLLLFFVWPCRGSVGGGLGVAALALIC